MKPTHIFIGISIIYLLAYAAHAMFLGQTVYGDGMYYFSWLRSLVLDMDIDFTNEYAHFGISQLTTPRGLPRNIYAIGPALLWSPGYLWIHSLVKQDGYTFLYQFATGLMSVGYALTGLMLLYRVLRNFFTETASIATILTVALATNLLFYGAVDTVNSHALSFFAASLFLTALLDTSVRARFMLLGISLGLLTIVRIQNAVFGLALLPMILDRRIIHTLIAFVGLVAIQFTFWGVLYGRFGTIPYLTLGLGFSQPQIGAVLFSSQSGLIRWTPIVGLSIIGLLTRRVIPHVFHMVLVGVFVMQLLIVSSWEIWWQGASYSGRMFVSSLPILALGLAAVLQSMISNGWSQRSILYAITGPLSILNAGLIWYFLTIT